MDTKEKILSESFLLFLNNGLSNISITDIIKKCEIGTGTFYYYFKNKEDLVSTVIDKFFLEVAFEKLNNAKEFKGNSKEKIEYIIYLTLTYKPVSSDSKALDDKLMKSYDRRDLNIFLFESMRYYESISKKNQTFHKELENLYKTIINEGIKNNEIKNLDIPDLERLIYNITYGTFYSSMIFSELDVKKVIKSDLDNIWTLIEK